MNTCVLKITDGLERYYHLGLSITMYTLLLYYHYYAWTFCVIYGVLLFGHLYTHFKELTRLRIFMLYSETLCFGLASDGWVSRGEILVLYGSIMLTLDATGEPSKETIYAFAMASVGLTCLIVYILLQDDYLQYPCYIFTLTTLFYSCILQLRRLKGHFDIYNARLQLSSVFNTQRTSRDFTYMDQYMRQSSPLMFGYLRFNKQSHRFSIIDCNQEFRQQCQLFMSDATQLLSSFEIVRSRGVKQTINDCLLLRLLRLENSDNRRRARSMLSGHDQQLPSQKSSRVPLDHINPVYSVVENYPAEASRNEIMNSEIRQVISLAVPEKFLCQRIKNDIQLYYQVIFQTELSDFNEDTVMVCISQPLDLDVMLSKLRNRGPVLTDDGLEVGVLQSFLLLQAKKTQKAYQLTLANRSLKEVRASLLIIVNLNFNILRSLNHCEPPMVWQFNCATAMEQVTDTLVEHPQYKKYRISVQHGAQSNLLITNHRKNLKQLVINVLEVIRFVHKYNRLPPEQETIIVFTYKCHDAHIQVNISARGLDLPIFFRQIPVKASETYCHKGVFCYHSAIEISRQIGDQLVLSHADGELNFQVNVARNIKGVRSTDDISLEEGIISSAHIRER